eukprot:gnl/Trimastix_PCT/3952.p1 GENE.gnl/Trimastix_PCT/3952~~gnl/Trimastix_PCT/3952.p1  ORF type:complete len:422 (-),score=95.46 gnl/Trimastix_PCT/3952:195-1316(-)
MPHARPQSGERAQLDSLAWGAAIFDITAGPPPSYADRSPPPWGVSVVAKNRGSLENPFELPSTRKISGAWLRTFEHTDTFFDVSGAGPAGPGSPAMFGDSDSDSESTTTSDTEGSCGPEDGACCVEPGDNDAVGKKGQKRVKPAEESVPHLVWDHSLGALGPVAHLTFHQYANPLIGHVDPAEQRAIGDSDGDMETVNEIMQRGNLFAKNDGLDGSVMLSSGFEYAAHQLFGRALFATVGNHIRCWSFADGETLRAYYADAPDVEFHSVTEFNGMLYAGTLDGRIFSWKISTGEAYGAFDFPELRMRRRSNSNTALPTTPKTSKSRRSKKHAKAKERDRELPEASASASASPQMHAESDAPAALPVIKAKDIP